MESKMKWKLQLKAKLKSERKNGTNKNEINEK